MWNFAKDRIKALREMKGLKQSEFAASLGVPKQTIHAWESGKISPSIASLIKICNAHECQPGYFFTCNGKASIQNG